MQAKASLLFFAVFLVIILPVLFVIYNKVKSTLEDADTRELVAEAEKILGQVRLDPPLIPLPPSGYSLKLQQRQDIYFIEIFTSPDFPAVGEETFLLDSYEYDTVKVVNLHRSAEGSANLVLSLARSNTRLLVQMNNVRVYLFLASGAAILIAGFLVFLSAGIMLRPLGKIINVAERINASNSIERVPVPNTRDENEKLAETLNEMLSRIESSIKNQINFFASATHELKTPLTVMQTELSISLAKTKDPETTKILESQLSEVQRLDRIIHDFLLMSQLKSESLTIRKKEARLDEVVYASMKQLKYLSQDRRIQVQVMLDDHDRMTTTFDFDKIQTVMTNLIENAVKYSPEQSIIRVSIKNQTVAINNPLMKPIEDISRLTGEFNKSEELSSGLGMGLWLSDQIVRLHGATLQLSQERSEFIARVTFESVHVPSSVDAEV